jgi:hypothetical protein
MHVAVNYAAERMQMVASWFYTATRAGLERSSGLNCAQCCYGTATVLG